MVRILVVDDSPTIHLYVRQALQADGHVIDRLSNFTELPAYMAACEPDVILLDLEMPALSGSAFAHFVRRIERRPIPIIVYSSLPATETGKAAREIGASGVVAKSSSPEQLRAAIARCVAAGGGSA
ncbi:MAG TPA: response regulator [Polyangiaceae bacterium]|nr:response regulator [Polyangiaceae bacterium]